MIIINNNLKGDISYCVILSIQNWHGRYTKTFRPIHYQFERRWQSFPASRRKEAPRWSIQESGIWKQRGLDYFVNSRTQGESNKDIQTKLRAPGSVHDIHASIRLCPELHWLFKRGWSTIWRPIPLVEKRGTDQIDLDSLKYHLRGYSWCRSRW